MCHPSRADVPDSISFDSLKSLPTTLPWLRKQQAQQQAQAAAASGTDGAAAAAQPAVADGGLPPVPGQVASLMQRPTFEAVAAALRKRLGLTLFGFDLVFDSIAGAVGKGQGNASQLAQKASCGKSAECTMPSCALPSTMPSFALPQLSIVLSSSTVGVYSSLLPCRRAGHY